MKWNYRVIEFVEATGDPFRQVHEVYYNEEGEPESYGESPAAVVWGVEEEGAGHDVLQMMAQALDKPVLVEADFSVNTTIENIALEDGDLFGDAVEGDAGAGDEGQ